MRLEHCSLCYCPDETVNIVYKHDNCFNIKYLLQNRTNDNSPHFIVKVTANGEWCMSLIDTGASISFVSVKYLIQHKFKAHKSAQPTAVRLGNGNIHHCTEHVNLNMTVEGHDCDMKCLVMPLPPGIDVILGMDWCNQNNVWLNPASHRIIFNADLGSENMTLLNLTMY